MDIQGYAVGTSTACEYRGCDLEIIRTEIGWRHVNIHGRHVAHAAIPMCLPAPLPSFCGWNEPHGRHAEFVNTLDATLTLFCPGNISSQEVSH